MKMMESGGSVTVKQAADMLGISVRTLYNKINRNEISYTDYDIKRIGLEDLEAFQNAHYHRTGIAGGKRK